MKTIGLIGATGFVGQRVTKELVSRGYNVKALARNVAQISADEQVTPFSVDINDQAALVDVLKGSDAVISAFNAGWTNPNLYQDFLEGARAIEQAVEKAGVKRFIVVGGAGSLHGPDGKQLVESEGFPTEIKPGALAARDYLNELKNNTQLDWTFFSPAIEMHPGTSGQRKGSYRTALETPVYDETGRSYLSVEDVAVVLVDELEKNNFVKKRFTAGY